MEKHFMIDIEATGIDHTKEDLLSIGILEAEFSQRYWRPGRSKEWIVRCERKPESEFAKEHMAALYDCYSQLHTLNGLIAIARGEA